MGRLSRLALVCIAHAGLLTVFTLFWMSISTWEFGDEILVERITQSRYLLLKTEDPQVAQLKKKLLLINCSYDKMLAPYADLYGSGTIAITDRKKLRDLFHIINESPTPPAYTVWDLFLDDPSPYDSALTAELKKLKKVVVSSHLTDSGTLYQPHPDLDYALAQFATMSGTFLKYRLLHNDSVSYMPLRLYEKLHDVKFSKIGGFAFSPTGWWLNSFIVDLPIRRVHMDENEITVWNVGEALENFTVEEIRSTVSDRLLIVGDFYGNDIHPTFLGNQPGPLILINTYLGIEKGRARISTFLFLLIFLLYAASTAHVLRQQQHAKLMTEKVLRIRIGKFLLKYLSYIVIFALFTILVYALTGQHLQLLLFALYFNVLDYTMAKYRGPVERFLKT
ncbi:MAG: hypothetical protein K2U26_14525 [Cyclobacteriaceae bacterium]|nr:hypothetical protein [Cyclobacteriaceae bacterium]